MQRAEAYVDAMPPGISGQGRHTATVEVANVLLHGFGLTDGDAWAILVKFNGRCQPPSDEAKLKHRFMLAKRFSNEGKEKFWLREGNREYGESLTGRGFPKGCVPSKRPAPTYDPEGLRAFAGHWAREVDLLWLANRSALDPATLSSADFLRVIYGEQKILLFNVCSANGSQVTQGEAVWPADEPLRTGRYGVWFLPQPVDGLYHPNPRTEGNKPSRRSEESIVKFPFLVLESDEAPVREWLGALVQLPLRIVAIYTSGGRSVHALVRVDAATKSHWDGIKAALAPGLRFLITNGLDKGVLSAVRLSRLPQAFREGKVGKDDAYVRFERPALQKLLYINPRAQARPLCELWPVRDVEKDWYALAAEHEPHDADETAGAWLRRPLRYYATVSKHLRRAHLEVERQWREMANHG